MINSKRVPEFARRWHKMPAMKSPKSLFPGCDTDQSSSVASKGLFAVYITDGTWFRIPLEYLKSSVLGNSLRITAEEFGLPTDGPVTLPCDSAFREYVMSLLKRCIPEDPEKALLTHLETYDYSMLTQFALGQSHQQTLIRSY